MSTSRVWGGGLLVVVASVVWPGGQGGGPRQVCAQDGAPAAPPNAPGRYVGAQTCDAAACHTKPEPRERPPYLTEYTSWSAMNGDVPYDRHSYAWRRLRGADKGGDDRSPAMMEKLNALEGTTGPAERSARCLSCHGTSVHDYGVGAQNPGAPVALHKALQGARFRPEEGVNCDGCHGPAEKWIKPHEKQDWTIEEWRRLGGPQGGSQKLYDEYGIYYSKDLELWANQCVRCHLRIDTNLLDAGHPDLIAFELFSQSAQVPHWRDYSFEAEDPALPGAGLMHAARSWQVGQAVALRSAFEQLHERAAGVAPNRPDPAHVRAALERAHGHWVVARHRLRVAAEGPAKAIEAQLDALRAAIPAEGELDLAKVASAAKEARAAVAPLARALADGPLDPAAVVAVMKAICADPDAAAAGVAGEQARLGLYSLNHARLAAADPDALFADPPAEKGLLAVYALYDHEPGTDGYAAALAAVAAALE